MPRTRYLHSTSPARGQRERIPRIMMSLRQRFHPCLEHDIYTSTISTQYVPSSRSEGEDPQNYDVTTVALPSMPRARYLYSTSPARGQRERIPRIMTSLR
ncbi:hypothetical protein J6590_014851 [Homalodisca vitripennis]|nr:hypothetical protein J6590_014851 [Homalodisca vitripennis]